MRFLRMILLGLLAGGMVMPGAVLAQTQTLVDVATISMSAPGVPRTVTNTVCATDGNDLVCDRGVYITSDNRVGIGTSSPTTKMEVRGIIRAIQPSYSYVRVDTEDSTEAAVLTRNADGYYGFGTYGDNFSVLDYSLTVPTQRLIITKSGRVGISPTQLPETKLDIDGTIRIKDSGEVCDANRTGAIRYTGGDFSFCRNGSAWETLAAIASASDRIVSGTSSVVVQGAQGRIYFNVSNSSPASIGPDGRFTTSAAILTSNSGALYSDTEYGNHIFSVRNNSASLGTIEIFMGGDTANQLAYIQAVKRGVIKVPLLLNAQGGNVGVGTNNPAAKLDVSGTLRIGNGGEVCDTSRTGAIRYNSPTTTLELCTGSGWQPMGVGIPAGTISAFASTTCPTGWSEYTAARGRFLRGIDNGAGNDPDGTRAPGNAQVDLFRSHYHTSLASGASILNTGVGHIAPGTSVGGDTTANITGNAGGAETRPKNVAVTFCQFNGTSNGWNNPLSGGSTLAAGSTGQVQYNTAGSFDASPDFAWSNGSKVLGVNGGISTTKTISTTDVYMAKSGGQCSTADDIGRMFRSAATGKLQICADRN